MSHIKTKLERHLMLERNGLLLANKALEMQVLDLQLKNYALSQQIESWKCNWQESTGREIELNKEIDKLRETLTPNVQIEGQAASGLALSNAGLCVNTTERGDE